MFGEKKKTELGPKPWRRDLLIHKRNSCLPEVLSEVNETYKVATQFHYKVCFQVLANSHSGTVHNSSGYQCHHVKTGQMYSETSEYSLPSSMNV